MGDEKEGRGGGDPTDGGAERGRYGALGFGALYVGIWKGKGRYLFVKAAVAA